MVMYIGAKQMEKMEYLHAAIRILFAQGLCRKIAAYVFPTTYTVFVYYGILPLFGQCYNQMWRFVLYDH